jgi:hypothetical protein
MGLAESACRSLRLAWSSSCAGPGDGQRADGVSAGGRSPSPGTRPAVLIDEAHHNFIPPTGDIGPSPTCSGAMRAVSRNRSTAPCYTGEDSGHRKRWPTRASGYFRALRLHPCRNRRGRALGAEWRSLLLMADHMPFRRRSARRRIRIVFQNGFALHQAITTGDWSSAASMAPRHGSDHRGRDRAGGSTPSSDSPARPSGLATGSALLTIDSTVTVISGAGREFTPRRRVSGAAAPGSRIQAGRARRGLRGRDVSASSRASTA